MKKVIVLLGLLSIFSACSSPPKEPTIQFDYEQDYFDPGLSRYTIRLAFAEKITRAEAMEISAYIKYTHTKGENLIIFFTKKGCTGSFYRVDYPSNKLEELQMFCE